MRKGREFTCRKEKGRKITRKEKGKRESARSYERGRLPVNEEERKIKRSEFTWLRKGKGSYLF